MMVYLLFCASYTTRAAQTQPQLRGLSHPEPRLKTKSARVFFSRACFFCADGNFHCADGNFHCADGHFQCAEPKCADGHFFKKLNLLFFVYRKSVS